MTQERAHEIGNAIDALQLWLADLRVKLPNLTYLQLLDRWSVIPAGVRELEELIERP